MKIGILTHHYINNFGAFLQAYALQECLKKIYPNDEIYIINYINIKHYLINTGGWFRFYKDKESFNTWKEKICLPRVFSKERKKYLNLTKPCLNAKDVEKLNLDYVVVGSDEVWNYMDSKGNAKIKFGTGLDNDKLVAYAPSVGQATSNEIPDYVYEGILKFKTVSARDVLTKEIAEKIRNEKIQIVVDPTFLTTIPDESVNDIKKPYMLFYYCEGLSTLEMDKLINYAKENGMEVYGAGECNKKYSKNTVKLTPFQWVWMFKNASCVVTGTFHGTVFSMLNHKKFACYLTKPSRIKKVQSLLERYGLEDHICSKNIDEIIHFINKEINYSKLEERFDLDREKSIEFIKKSIN